MKEKGAKEFTKPASDRLMNLLNRHPDLPIVAHNVKYDRDDVLKPAFTKVKNLDKLPPQQRWRCTLAMAKFVPKLFVYDLVSCLDHFKIEGREGDKHDALEDCRLTAKFYMELMNRPESKNTTLGFCTN